MNEAVEFLKSLEEYIYFFPPMLQIIFCLGLMRRHILKHMNFYKHKGLQNLYSPIAMDRNLVGYQVPHEVEELKTERIQKDILFQRRKIKIYMKSFSLPMKSLILTGEGRFVKESYKGCRWNGSLLREKRKKW